MRIYSGYLVARLADEWLSSRFKSCQAPSSALLYLYIHKIMSRCVLLADVSAEATMTSASAANEEFLMDQDADSIHSDDDSVISNQEAGQDDDDASSRLLRDFGMVPHWSYWRRDFQDLTRG